MITTKVKVLEGVKFQIDVSLEEPFEYRHGVRVEIINHRYEDKTTYIILKALGFRFVEYEPWTDNAIYIQHRIPYLRYKLVKNLIKAYWATLVFLYDNARIFKKIPEGEQFSWEYFTPYTWFKALRDRIHKRKVIDSADITTSAGSSGTISFQDVRPETIEVNTDNFEDLLHRVPLYPSEDGYIGFISPSIISPGFTGTISVISMDENGITVHSQEPDNSTLDEVSQ